MKNKKFLALSQEKRQKNLAHILRAKTSGLLETKEEVAILCAAMCRKQFVISVFNDINKFRSEAGKIDESKDGIIYGSLAIKKMKKNALIDTGIAVIINKPNNNNVGLDRLLIYIPETRNCKAQCAREKYICEHLEKYDEDTFCCDLHLVRV